MKVRIDITNLQINMICNRVDRGRDRGYLMSPHIGAQNPEFGQNRDKASNAFMTSVLYENGAFLFAANLDRIGKVANSAKITNGSVKVWNTAASYDARFAKITAAFGQDIDGRIGKLPFANLASLGVNPVPNATYVHSFMANNYSLGAVVPLEHGDLLLNWMMSDANLTDVRTAGKKASVPKMVLALDIPTFFQMGLPYMRLELIRRTWPT